MRIYWLRTICLVQNSITLLQKTVFNHFAPKFILLFLSLMELWKRRKYAQPFFLALSFLKHTGSSTSKFFSSQRSYAVDVSLTCTQLELTWLFLIEICSLSCSHLLPTSIGLLWYHESSPEREIGKHPWGRNNLLHSSIHYLTPRSTLTQQKSTSIHSR